MWYQQIIQLTEKQRGFHLITEEIVEAVPQISSIRCGLLHLFLQHTSASLTLNENYDPTVQIDMENYFLNTVPEQYYWMHNDEGKDDMPAHVKSSILGCSLLLPISDGQLKLGTWQGIWLGEHRNHGGKRHIMVTLHGDLF